MVRFIVDLDGTLVDSVYQHVLAWHLALQACGFTLPMWQIHRKIGMSGGLLIRALSTELGLHIDDALKKRLEDRHSQEFAHMRETIVPFPGARELLQTFSRAKVPFAIATSGDRSDVQPLLDLVGVDDGVPVVFKNDAPLPKPDPGLLLAAAAKLPDSSDETLVVGDSVWDMLASRRAHFLGVGLLTGGYGESELTGAGAFRVYADPAQMLSHLHEIGVITEANMERQRYSDEDLVEREIESETQSSETREDSEVERRSGPDAIRTVDPAPPHERAEVIYGETDIDPNREDQRSAHHAEDDEHL